MTNFRLFQREFADNNYKFDENGIKFSKWVENTVGKGEIDCHKLFVIFTSTGHRPASLCHGLLSVVRPSGRVSVRPCVNFFFKHFVL